MCLIQELTNIKISVVGKRIHLVQLISHPYNVVLVIPITGGLGPGSNPVQGKDVSFSCIILVRGNDNHLFGAPPQVAYSSQFFLYSYYILQLNFTLILQQNLLCSLLLDKFLLLHSV